MTEAVDALVDSISELVTKRIASRLGDHLAEWGRTASPWLTTDEAITYSRLPEGTFRKLAACGKIPSHGGRSKIFYRPEVDQALMSSDGLTEDTRRLRSVR